MTTVTATILCVTIHRRHLMVSTAIFILAKGSCALSVTKNIGLVFLQVWGLFAPKFVFDVVGLILTDVLICLASAYYL